MRFTLIDLELYISADHHPAELLRRSILNIDRTNAFALSENGAAVSHLHYLVQLVRNKQDGFSFSGE